MKNKKIMVAGTGVLGSQIAFQTAFKGFNVAMYDINDESIEKAKERIKVLQERYQEDKYGTKEEVDAAFSRLTFETDLAKAVEDAYLVIEAVPEMLKIKEDFYTKLSKVAGPDTIFASNSSTLIPSQIVNYTDRPEKFLHLHFANEIWKFNVAEVMKHPGTSDKVFDEIVDFAKEIAMVPVPIYKEQPAYVLNTLLVPFLNAGMQLAMDGITSPEMIDKTWMIATGAVAGPMMTIDIVGMNTVYNISKAAGENGDEMAGKFADWIKSDYIDQGKMGKQNGKGFYTYPNPAFEDPNFLK